METNKRCMTNNRCTIYDVARYGLRAFDEDFESDFSIARRSRVSVKVSDGQVAIKRQISNADGAKTSGLTVNSD